MRNLSLPKFKIEHLESYFKKMTMQAASVEHNAPQQYSNSSPVVSPLLEVKQLRLQPSFVTNEDKCYQIDDLLKFQDRDFIQNAYRAILNRQPDPSGVASYLEALRSGKLDKINVLKSLRYSPEGQRQNAVVNGLQEQIKKSRLKQLRYVGYFVRWFIILLTLPRLTRDYLRLSTHTFAWFEETVSYLNNLTNQINAQLDHTTEIQLRLHNKLNDQLDEIEGKFKEQLNESREQLSKQHLEFNNNLETRLSEQFTQINRILKDELDKQGIEIDGILKHELNKQSIEFDAILNEKIAAATKSLRVELAAHRRRVNELEQTVQASPKIINQTVTSALIKSASSDLPETSSEVNLDEFFVAFAEKFRGSPEDIKNRLSVYLPLVERALNNSLSGEKLIVDLACGRGEWLELLAEQGWHAIGIDTNRLLIESCRERGLDAVQMDALKYLQTLPNESCICVTGMHIIEHLPLEILITFINEVMRVLRPGGLVIFETPNPDNLQVGSRTFYFDPTHRNPLPALLTQFMLETSGFVEIEVLALHPWKEAQLPEDSAPAQRINELFYGPMDYGIVGWRDAN